MRSCEQKLTPSQKDFVHGIPTSNSAQNMPIFIQRNTQTFIPKHKASQKLSKEMATTMRTRSKTCPGFPLPLPIQKHDMEEYDPALPLAGGPAHTVMIPRCTDLIPIE
jgi:hypothetical protein